MSSRFFVYILASQRNGTLYTGVTNNLARRISEHKSGLMPGFTRRYGVDRLVHVEDYGSILEARVRERKLKRWRREWKLELIEASIQPGAISRMIFEFRLSNDAASRRFSWVPDRRSLRSLVRDTRR